MDIFYFHVLIQQKFQANPNLTHTINAKRNSNSNL